MPHASLWSLYVMLLKDRTVPMHADLSSLLADARTAVATVALPLVAHAVALHREAVAAQVWPAEPDDFDGAFRRWQVESGAGELRAALEQLFTLAGDCDVPADAWGGPS